MIETEIERKIKDLDAMGLPMVISRDVRINMADTTVSTIIGARRSGKSYRAIQAAREMVADGTLPSIRHVCMVDFDNPVLASATAADLISIQKTFLKLRPGFDLGTPILFILDEIQKVAGWENYVVDLSRNPCWKVLVTGSSSRMLGLDMATELRGKAVPTEIHPLSFAEFMRFKGSGRPVGSTAGDAEAMRLFDEYLQWGGYPAVVMADERVKEPLLREYFDTMTLRDIVQRHDVSRPRACLHTLRTLLSAIGRPVTVKSLLSQARAAGHLVSWETVNDYLSWGEDALAFFAVPIFTASLKEQERNYRKIYAIDWALANRNSPVWDGSLSRAFENAIYLHLRRRWSRVNYYLTRSRREEIDFVAIDGRGAARMTIQACFDISDPDTRAREIAPLVAAAKYLGHTECLVVTRGAQETVKQDGVTVRLTPAWRWMLEGD